MRILSFNIMAHKPDVAQPGRLDLIAQFALQQDVDVLCLQEGTAGLCATNSFRRLSKLTDYDYVCASCSQWWLRPWYQVRVGILSRSKIVDWDNWPLNTKMDDTWSEWALWQRRPIVRAAINGQNFFSLHSGGERDIPKILSCCCPGGIVAGDFNMSQGSPGYFQMKQLYGSGVGCAPDFIFSPNVPKSWDVVFDGICGPVVSDHYGILAEF